MASGIYAETRPPVLRTGKTHCGRVLICLDGLKKQGFLVSLMGAEGALPPAQNAFFS